MNLQNLKRYSKIGAVLILSLALSFYAGHWHRGNNVQPLPAAPAPSHDVIMSVPVKAKDKKALHDQGAISRTVEKAPGEITATGKISDDSGTRHVSSVLDTQSGESIIVQHREITERMHRHALGIGAGFRDSQFVKTAYYEYAGLRVWDFYVIGRGEVFLQDGKRPWDAIVAIEYRW